MILATINRLFHLDSGSLVGILDGVILLQDEVHHRVIQLELVLRARRIGNDGVVKHASEGLVRGRLALTLPEIFLSVIEGPTSASFVSTIVLQDKRGTALTRGQPGLFRRSRLVATSVALAILGLKLSLCLVFRRHGHELILLLNVQVSLAVHHLTIFIQVLFLFLFKWESDLKEGNHHLDRRCLNQLLRPEIKSHIDNHRAEGNQIGHKKWDVFLKDGIPGPNHGIDQGDT